MADRESISKKPKDIAFAPIKWIARLIIWAGALLIFLVSFSIIYYGFFGQGQLPERITLGLEKVNLDKPVLSGVDFIYSIASGKYWTQDITPIGTTKEEQVEIGMKINNFKPIENVISLKQPVTATAQIEVSQAPEDKSILLNFRNACYLEDYTDLESPKEAFVSKEEKVIVAGQDNFIFSVICDFPKGFDELLVIELGDKGKLVENSGSDIKTLRLTPSFVYEQKIDWQPFTKYQYSTDDKKGQDIINWGQSTGPISLRIGSDESQPFYINDQHMLKVILRYNWPGEIKGINDITIENPGDIELLTSDRICDFERYGNKYKLKYPVLQDTKIDCSSKEIRKTIVSEIASASWMPDIAKTLVGKYAKNPQEITYDECIKIYKNEFQFSCPFVVTNAERKAARTQLSVTANYIYEMSATSSVNLVVPEKGVA